MSRDPGFLDRWSRLKRDGAPAEEGAPAPDAALPDDRPDAEILEELDLPEPETLGPGSDFSAFMKEAVPARLRNRALRQLWGTNPVLANLDELLDYGEDFTDAATVVENLQTAYQVGRGFVLPEDDAPDNETAGEPAQASADGAQIPPEEAAEDGIADTDGAADGAQSDRAEGDRAEGDGAEGDPEPVALPQPGEPIPAEPLATAPGQSAGEAPESAEPVATVLQRPRRMLFRFGDT